jgi:hypothetical protein
VQLTLCSEGEAFVSTSRASPVAILKSGRRISEGPGTFPGKKPRAFCMLARHEDAFALPLCPQSAALSSGLRAGAWEQARRPIGCTAAGAARSTCAFVADVIAASSTVRESVRGFAGVSRCNAQVGATSRATAGRADTLHVNALGAHAMRKN